MNMNLIYFNRDVDDTKYHDVAFDKESDELVSLTSEKFDLTLAAFVANNRARCRQHLIVSRDTACHIDINMMSSVQPLSRILAFSQAVKTMAPIRHVADFPVHRHHVFQGTTHLHHLIHSSLVLPG